ncbi:MAG: single-stranded-DNA-specific exonuclease RecJ [Candidatus Marinimicrobia bacterium]|nr:single-stranded-DNA-specific exonuclease RecJ [Candidatus Neomarinimicrobiota bacterium]MCF7840284.1 single-stranded-DNA-specific exonuclease RecJ [Candidatus Neomarinimicrobiota bacterium]
MEKIWLIQNADIEAIQQLSRQLRVSSVVAGLLWRRGLHTLEATQDFFNPSLESLHDPFLMKGMETAVQAILKRIETHTPILIFGDYDVDGTTAASALNLFLQEVGAKVTFYIPDRDLEGYGVSLKGIDYAESIGSDLIITCDCGITAVRQTEYAKSKGIDMIITDHHIPGETLPEAVAILNPKQPDCEYPFKGLCGAGVAFKLTQALTKTLNVSPLLAEQNLDLISIGTAADLVPVVGENRIILSRGLTMIEEGTKPGIRALKETSRISGKSHLTSSDIVFGLGPRINAVGRLGEATRAVRLLTTRQYDEAKELAGVMEGENDSRKLIEADIVDEAIRIVNARYNPREKHGLVVYNEGWHHGVIGIVASKLKERYWVPVIVIAINDGIGKGSARSLEGFDMYEAIADTEDLLDNFGGHPMAAGLTIKAENLVEFEKRFLEITEREISAEMMNPRLNIEEVIQLSDINTQLIATLRRLGPFGPGNMRPIFASRGVQVVGFPRIVGVNHLKFKVREGRQSVDAIGFGMGEHYEMLIANKPVDVAYVITENEWQGRRTIQLEVKDLKPAT